MLWSINNTASALNLKKDMHCLLCIDARKTGGKMMLARALHLGMSMEIAEPSSNPIQNISSAHFDFAAMVPLQVHTLYALGMLDELNKIDTLIIGGASLNSSLINALQNVRTKIYATYGMTETASHIALQRINDKNRQDYFTPFPEVSISTNEEGCAMITTPFHEKLITTDIIGLHENNAFKIIGRSDHTINSGGYKISMEKVEDAIDKAFTSLKINFFPYCAYKQQDEKLGEALLVIFETEPLEPTLIEELKKELLNYLNKYELPKHFYFTKKLAYTISGKIDRARSALAIDN